jgi:glc operon protein GlcG
MRFVKSVAGIVVFVVGATVASAQAPVRPPYGTAINLETAKKIGEAAMTDAKKRNWNVTVAVVDNHGMLIWYQMQDDTQTSAAHLAIEKARTSATLRRPTKELEDGVAAGRVAVMSLGLAIDGGVPIVVGGKMIGAVGVSGMAAAQDAEIARAGLDAVK